MTNKGAPVNIVVGFKDSTGVKFERINAAYTMNKYNYTSVGTNGAKVEANGKSYTVQKMYYDPTGATNANEPATINAILDPATTLPIIKDEHTIKDAVIATTPEQVETDTPSDNDNPVVYYVLEEISNGKVTTIYLDKVYRRSYTHKTTGQHNTNQIKAIQVKHNQINATQDTKANIYRNIHT